jgi:hypothetical protein
MTGKWNERPDYCIRTISKAVSSPHVVPNTNAQSGIVLQSYGDIRNAKAFAQVACGQFLYIATRDRWLSWSQEKWQSCEKDEHVAMAKDVCGQILNAANDVFGQDQERGKRLVQEAMAAHNLSRITAMLKLTVSEPDMATTDRELDRDPYPEGKSGKNRYYCGLIIAVTAVLSSTQDGVDRIEGILGNSLHGNLSEEKTPNSPSSCPTCPDDIVTEGAL